MRAKPFITLETYIEVEDFDFYSDAIEISFLPQDYHFTSAGESWNRQKTIGIKYFYEDYQGWTSDMAKLNCES